MTQLPQAENQLGALDRRRRSLLREGWDADQLNRGVLLRHLLESDWSPFRDPVPGIDPARFLNVLLRLGKEATLGEEAVARLASGGLGSPADLRRSPAEPWCEGHQPVLPSLIQVRLARFFEWAGSPAFQDLQPLLQLSLTQLRLGELVPWENHSGILCFWLGVLPLLRAGYLLPAYSQDHLARFGPALQRGLAFDTGPLVGLNLDAALRSYELIEELR